MNKKLENISNDITLLLFFAEKKGWSHLYLSSITRLLYFSAIYANFINESITYFSENYIFCIKLEIACNDINNAINILIKKGLIKNEKNLISLTNKIDISPLKHSSIIEVIIEVLSFYEQDKLYDFIYRDREFISKLETSDKLLNIDINNNSIKELNLFKNGFEIVTEKILKNEKYLILYFDYLYSLIIKSIKMR